MHSWHKTFSSKINESRQKLIIDKQSTHNIIEFRSFGVFITNSYLHRKRINILYEGMEC